MKKKTALSILSLCVCCAGGGASAQNPWDNALRSFPDRRTDVTIKEHGGSGCDPQPAPSFCQNNAGDIDVSPTVASSEGVSVPTVDPDWMYAPSETGCAKFPCNKKIVYVQMGRLLRLRVLRCILIPILALLSPLR